MRVDPGTSRAVALGFVCLMLVGCGGSPSSPAAEGAWGVDVRRSLVLRSAHSPQTGWEHGRHDVAMGAGREVVPDHQTMIHRSYDRYWTSNGRPREHSGSRTVIIRRPREH